jgi:hypothetical protein
MDDTITFSFLAFMLVVGLIVFGAMFLVIRSYWPKDGE